MMHVRFNEAWHGMGKCNKQHYKLSGAQYATSCILTKNHMTYLVISRLCTQQDYMLLAWQEGEANENYLSIQV